MGLNRKKSRYVSFDEFVKPSVTDRAGLTPADADDAPPAPAILVSDNLVEEPLDGGDDSSDEQGEDESDIAQRLSEIEAHVSQARLHIHKALVEDSGHREDGDSSDPTSAEPTVEPELAPPPDELRKPLGQAKFVRYLMDDIDESDVESIEKAFFEERPVSIEENMRQADAAHARQQKNTLVFALIAVLLALGVGLVVFGLASLPSQDDTTAGSVLEQTDSSQEAESTELDESFAKNDPEGADALEESPEPLLEPLPPVDVDQVEPSVEDEPDIVEPSKEDLEPSPRYDMQTAHQGGA